MRPPLDVLLSIARHVTEDPDGTDQFLLAATALLHGLTLVTRNEWDFQHPAPDVVNPWKA
jgi:predicted nucleic acid-binding protein